MNQYEFINKGMIVTVYLSLPAIWMNGPTPVLKQLLFVGVVGMAITMVGMEVFLFRFDDSTAWKQILWFCVMLLPPLGPALYCYLVYSKSTAVKDAAGSTATVLTDPKPKA